MKWDKLSEHQTHSDVGIQKKIEDAMMHYGEEDRWECIYLFSSDGLLMAQYGSSVDYNEDALLEFAFSLISAVKLLREDLLIQDIFIRGKNRKRLIFRYFEAWDEQLIFSAVISGRKGYLRALGRLVSYIQGLE